MRVETGAAARRRLPRDERRALILTGAARVFAERGYEAASLDEIAAAADISKPVIYDHFDSKRDLHISLLESHSQELLEFMGARVVTGKTSEEQLANGFDAFFEFVEDHPYAWRLIFTDPTASDPEIARAYERIQKRAADAIFAMTAAQPGVAADEDDVVDDETVAELLAQMLKTAGNGLAAWWYEHREVPRERLVRAMMEFAWLGIERCQSGERWRGPARR